jgi:hypothetical protein
MTRDNVEKYLQSRGVEYHWSYDGEGSEHYLVEIGEEPGSLVCRSWKVYIALYFDATNKVNGRLADFTLDPSDKLTKVQIKKIGTCL